MTIPEEHWASAGKELVTELRETAATVANWAEKGWSPSATQSVLLRAAEKIEQQAQEIHDLKIQLAGADVALRWAEGFDR